MPLRAARASITHILRPIRHGIGMGYFRATSTNSVTPHLLSLHSGSSISSVRTRAGPSAVPSIDGAAAFTRVMNLLVGEGCVAPLPPAGVIQHR